MAVKVSLDTNVYSALLRPDKPDTVRVKTEVREILEHATQIFLPVVVYGELLAGFLSGSRERENRDLLQEFISAFQVRILETNAETAEWFAAFRHKLKSRGKMIPMNDLWIACLAAQSGSRLLTLDKHFREVPEIAALIPGV